MGVRVLSLFDGMACGMLAMRKAGIAVDEYIAYEIDKYAIKTATHNFPMIKECGDVFTADFTQYKDIDYIVGGSPCTFWSIAQKNNRETEASGLGWELFSQYVRALNDVKPKFFIYENNKSMSNAIRESITKTFGFEPICINSALVSAQNRQRLYWVGKRNNNGTYDKVKIKQPEDKRIFLRDILSGGYDLTTNEKSWTLTASYNGAIPWNTIERCQRNMVAESVLVSTDMINNSISTIFLNSMSDQNNRFNAIATEYESNIPIKARSCTNGKIYTVYEVKNNRITIKGIRYLTGLCDGYYIIRKLTILECKKLQTVPEYYEFPVSDAQAYKMLGNGWTVDVIAHLITATLQ